MFSVSLPSRHLVLLLGLFVVGCSDEPLLEEEDTGELEAPLDGFVSDHTWLGSQVIFADATSGAILLGTDDGYSSVMSAYDRGLRIKTTDATTEDDYLDYAASSALDWQSDWIENWDAQVAEVGLALEGLQVPLPDPIYIVAADNSFEFGYPHTRGATIVLQRNVLGFTAPQGRRQLLAHELFHVLSRADLPTRDATYSLLGFELVEPIVSPSSHEDRRLSNPDAFSLEHTAELTSDDGTFMGAPFLHGSHPLEQAITMQGLPFELLVMDADTGAMLDVGDTNYSATVSINTNYDLHPEEALADNFSLLVLQRADTLDEVSDQGFVDSLETLLLGD